MEKIENTSGSYEHKGSLTKERKDEISAGLSPLLNDIRNWADNGHHPDNQPDQEGGSSNEPTTAEMTKLLEAIQTLEQLADEWRDPSHPRFTPTTPPDTYKPSEWKEQAE